MIVAFHQHIHGDDDIALVVVDHPERCSDIGLVHVAVHDSHSQILGLIPGAQVLGVGDAAANSQNLVRYFWGGFPKLIKLLNAQFDNVHRAFWR
ncbi:hypothetical protein D3C76_1742990 [compost metagenome]